MSLKALVASNNLYLVTHACIVIGHVLDGRIPYGESRCGVLRPIFDQAAQGIALPQELLVRERGLRLFLIESFL